MKEIVAAEIAKRIKDGDVIGVGSGSTVNAAIAAIALRVKNEKLSLSILPTSRETARRCQEAGIKVIDSYIPKSLAWGFDGADEVDAKLRLIKGRGAALLLEKIVACCCKEFVIIVDDSKMVTRLGEKSPVPVEIIPEAVKIVEAELKALGASEIELRKVSGQEENLVTEKGHYILDARFGQIDDDLEAKVNSIVGVVENGIFTKYATEVLVASASGVRKITL